MISRKLKNAALVLGSICLISIIGYFTYQGYWYFHPQFALGSAKSSDSLDYSFSVPTIEIRESVFGTSDNAESVLKDFSNENSAFLEKISTEYEKPINIKYDVTYEDGKTVFSFYGTACSKADKSIVEINEKLVFASIAKTQGN